MAKEKEKKADAVDTTPSGKALAAVGEGPEVKHSNVDAALEHGEKYQAAKKKQRWG
jgi:hypothetical protein